MSNASDIAPPRRPSVRFLLAHPAHFLALGLGSAFAQEAAIRKNLALQTQREAA